MAVTMDRHKDASWELGKMQAASLVRTLSDSQRIMSLEVISAELRSRIYSTVKTAGSGHLGGTSSSVELITALYFGGLLRYDINNPRNSERDRVLVRGHMGPLRYSLFSLLGWVGEEELKTYRQLGSRLQGHESMELVPGVDITPSGSLGMLLSYGVGCGYAAKSMGRNFKTYIFLGDGEEEEGNVSEAARHAAKLGLDNIVCILDKNEKQLSRPIKDVDSTDIRKLWEAYGWDVREIYNGNSIKDVLEAYQGLTKINRPTFVIAHTTKGKGLIGAEENCCGYHTISSCTNAALVNSIEEHKNKVLESGLDPKSLARELASKFESKEVDAIEAQKVVFNLQSCSRKSDIPSALKDSTGLLAIETSRHKLRLYAMTADMVRSDTIRTYGFVEGTHYIDVGLREQHLFAMAHGISHTDRDSRILILPGEQFMYRAADQLNVMAQAGTKAVIIVLKAGLADNHNGSTHQSVGQPGMFFTMPEITVLEPADVLDFYNCVNYAFTEYDKPIYLRLTDVPVRSLSAKNRNVRWYVLDNPHSSPDIVFVASGFPVSNAVEAGEKLYRERGIISKVINVINQKSLDEGFVRELAEGKPVLTLYNGHPDILRQNVASTVMEFDSNRPSTIHGHGFRIGTSGKLDALIRHFKLDADGIAELAADLVSLRRGQ